VRSAWRIFLFLSEKTREEEEEEEEGSITKHVNAWLLPTSAAVSFETFFEANGLTHTSLGRSL